MRWAICGQPTSIPIEHQMHDIIGLGIGHLAKVPPEDFNAEGNHQVYIDEPLIILYLRCLFEKWHWTSRKVWISNLLSSALERLGIGYIFEEVVLMVLVEKFGNTFIALNEVFDFPQASTVGSRKVRLVSLRRDADGVMRCSPVSWTAGSSDQIGFNAVNPADVLAFFKDPYGKAALFPDVNCGPDLMNFFQEEKTGELIGASWQAKGSPTLKTEMWIQALNSVAPDYFYTVVVHFGIESR